MPLPLVARNERDRDGPTHAAAFRLPSDIDRKRHALEIPIAMLLIIAQMQQI
jgi:hypothetical protein